jgi:hypothetical protein
MLTASSGDAECFAVAIGCHGIAFGSYVDDHLRMRSSIDPERIRHDSWKLIVIGALLVVGAVAGGYVYPGFANPIETIRGVISEAEFVLSNEGRHSLAEQRRTATLGAGSTRMPLWQSRNL